MFWIYSETESNKWVLISQWACACEDGILSTLHFCLYIHSSLGLLWKLSSIIIFPVWWPSLISLWNKFLLSSSCDLVSRIVCNWTCLLKPNQLRVISSDAVLRINLQRSNICSLLCGLWFDQVYILCMWMFVKMVHTACVICCKYLASTFRCIYMNYILFR